MSSTCLGLGLGDTIPEDFGVLELCRNVIGSCSLCERSWLRSGIRLESGGYVVEEVDDVAALSLEPHQQTLGTLCSGPQCYIVS